MTRARPAWPGELAVVGALLFVYDRVADLASVRASAAVEHGRQFLRLEAALHLAVERPAQAVMAAASWLSVPASLWYNFAHLSVTLAVLFAAWLQRPAVYRQLRNLLVMVNLLALSVFWLYPVAPPRLLPGSGFRDVVALSHTPGAWESSAAATNHANQYASAPSLHVAYALWVLLAAVLCTSRGWPRLLAAGHVVLTTAVVIGTGNHYLLDVATGGLTVAVAWWATRPRRDRCAAAVGYQEDVKMPAPGVKVA